MQFFSNFLRDTAGNEGTVDRQAFEDLMRMLGATEKEILMISSNSCLDGTRIQVDKMLSWLTAEDQNLAFAEPGACGQSPNSRKRNVRKSMGGDVSVFGTVDCAVLAAADDIEVPKGIPLDQAVPVLHDMVKAGNLPKHQQQALQNALLMLDRIVARSKGTVEHKINNLEQADMDDDTRAFLLATFAQETEVRVQSKLTFKDAVKRVILIRRFESGRPAQSTDIFSSWDVKLLQELGKMDSLKGFNIFEVNRLSILDPLSHVALFVFDRRSFLKTFNLPLDKVISFLKCISGQYVSNHYHNGLHAADVVQGVHLLCHQLRSSYFTDIEMFSAIIAAIGHDVGHPGVTNAYRVAIRDEQALVYNDVSVNENMHASLLYRTLNKEGCDFLGALTPQQYGSIRKMVVSMILATDMSQHFDHVKHLQCTLDDAGSDLSQWESTAEALEAVMHGADISNVSRPYAQAEAWAHKVLEEFFEQGDMERKRGLPVSPLCDRRKVTMAQSQPGFVQFIVQPLFDQLNMFCAVEPQLKNMKDYRQTWLDRAEAEKKEKESKGS